MRALRRQRPCALGLVGGAAIAARHRGNADEGRDPQSGGAHPHRRRALCAQPQARASARSRKRASRGVAITVSADATVGGQQSFIIERGEQVHTLEAAKALLAQAAAFPPPVEEEDEEPTRTSPRKKRPRPRRREAKAKPKPQARAPSRARMTASAADAAADGVGAGPRGGGASRGTAPRSRAEHVAPRVKATGRRGGRRGRPGRPERSQARATGESERRRRRRGRRGGRRNRRGREGEAEFRNGDGQNGQAEHDDERGCRAGGGGRGRRSGRSGAQEAPTLPEPHADRSRSSRSHATADRWRVQTRTRAPPAHGRRHRACCSGRAPKRRSTVREPGPMFSSGAMSDVAAASRQRGIASAWAEAPPRRAGAANQPREPAEAEAKPRRVRRLVAAGRDHAKSWVDSDAQAAVDRYAGGVARAGLARSTPPAARAGPQAGAARRRQHLGEDPAPDLIGEEAEVLCMKGSGSDMARDRARGPAGGAAARCASCARDLARTKT